MLEEVLAQKRTVKDLKEEKNLKLKTCKALQYNITWILHISSSNKMFSSIHDFTFLMTHKLRTSLFWVFRKKESFASTIFGKNCYVACVINCARKFISLPACLHECKRMGLIDKPVCMFKSLSPLLLNPLTFARFSLASLLIKMSIQNVPHSFKIEL